MYFNLCNIATYIASEVHTVGVVKDSMLTCKDFIVLCKCDMVKSNYLVY